MPDPDPATPRRRRRTPPGRTVAFVVVAAGLAAAGVIVAASADTDRTPDEATHRPESTASTGPDTTRPAASTIAPGDVAFPEIALPASVPAPPAQFVAVTDDGRVVMVDTATGRELRQLTAAGDPTTAAPAAGTGPNVIDRVALSPDGTTVWYSQCCEPAGGALFRVPADGTAPPTRVADGYDPAQTASRRWVAAVSTYGALIVDTTGAPNRLWWNDHDRGEHQEVAWSLDGEHLAVRTGTPAGGDLVIVDPDELAPAGDDAATRAVPPLRTMAGPLRLPAFARDGRILVARQTASTWEPWHLDPDTGEETPAPFRYERAEPIDQDYDPTGQWLIILEADDPTEAGTASWTGPKGQPVTPIAGTYRSVSW